MIPSAERLARVSDVLTCRDAITALLLQRPGDTLAYHVCKAPAQPREGQAAGWRSCPICMFPANPQRRPRP